MLLRRQCFQSLPFLLILFLGEFELERYVFAHVFVCRQLYVIQIENIRIPCSIFWQPNYMYDMKIGPLQLIRYFGAFIYFCKNLPLFIHLPILKIISGTEQKYCVPWLIIFLKLLKLCKDERYHCSSYSVVISLRHIVIFYWDLYQRFCLFMVSNIFRHCSLTCSC